jgi:hypothetical protein
MRVGSRASGSAAAGARVIQCIAFDAGDAVGFQGQTFIAWPGGDMRRWIARVLLSERQRPAAICRALPQ